jgi:hypothetical protein
MQLVAMILLLPVPVQPAEPLPVAPAAAESLKLPPKLESKRDRMIGVKAGGSAKRITWEIPAGVDFQPKPANMPPEAPSPLRVEMDAATVLMLCAAPGTYKLRAFAAISDSVVFAETTLTVIGDPAPQPPPAPPKPVDPPAPSDAFKVELLKLFTDATSEERKQGLTLASCYRKAAKEALDPANATLDDVLRLISLCLDAAEGLGPSVLKGVRERVKTELVAKAGDPAAEFDKGRRKIVADLYTRAAEAVEGATK